MHNKALVPTQTALRFVCAAQLGRWTDCELSRQTMEIHQNEQYEEIANEYHYQLVRLLDTALQETELTSLQREAVCERFVFDMAMLHDQGEVSVDGLDCQPTLAFLDGDKIRIPNMQFEMHEYALGECCGVL